MSTKSDLNSTIIYPSRREPVVAVSKPVVVGESVVDKSFKEMEKSSPMFNWFDTQKQLHPYYGAVGGVYYAMTGMPWLSSDARKAVLTEWFWQPIRGQPRRVDTNELRSYGNTIWVRSIVVTKKNQLRSIPWDVIPEEGFLYAEVEADILKAKSFFECPNDNYQSWDDIVSSWVEDEEMIDAGVLVKTFSIDSYDFEHLEPRSGAPLLKPLLCPECDGLGLGLSKDFKEKALKSLESIKRMDLLLKDGFSPDDFKKEFKLLKPDYSKAIEKLQEVVSYNSPSDANILGFDSMEEPEPVSCPFCNGTGRGRRLKEAYAMDGASFLKDADRTGWVYGYWQYSYAIPAHPMWFNKDEIIYFSMSVYGYSAMQAALDTVKTLDYSTQHNKALMIDGAVPDGMVSVEDTDDIELGRMRMRWENELKGQPHKVIFVNKRTTFSPFAFDNKELQFNESQLSNWKYVISMFNMTPVDLGITEDINKSTAATQAEMGRRKGIRPLMKKIEQLINDQLMPELGVQHVKFAYIIDDPTEERQMAELNEIYLRNNLKTVNEIRLDMGMPPVPWGDDQNLSSGFGFGAQNGFQEGQSEDGKPEDGKVKEDKVEGGEERPAESEGLDAQRKETEERPDEAEKKSFNVWLDRYQFILKDFSDGEVALLWKDYAFSAQVPFITTIQNLSTPVPFALPRKGHVNTQEPYRELAALCPGCGSEQIAPIQADINTVFGPNWYRCDHCHRTYSEEDMKLAIQTQESLHRDKEPFKLLENPFGQQVSMGPTAPTPNQVSVPMRDQNTGSYGGKTDTESELKPEIRGSKLKKKAGLKIEGFEYLDDWIGFDYAPFSLFVKTYLESYDFGEVEATERQRKGLSSVFIEAFSEGLNMTQLSERIVKLGFDEKSAEMIARTETIRIANEAKLLEAESKDYEKVQFTATRDNLTCKECNGLNFKVMKIKEAQGLIPVHPRCRCTFKVVV